MPDFIFFMHDDAQGEENDWEPYLARLKAGALPGRQCDRRRRLRPKDGKSAGATRLFIDTSRWTASITQTRLAVDHAIQAGGTVEIRALPRTDFFKTRRRRLVPTQCSVSAMCLSLSGLRVT